MELPLDLARTLDAVVTAGSLDAAAAALSITPSAVSQRLKSLETRVGRVLLVRSKPVQPTAAAVSYTHLDVYKRQGTDQGPHRHRSKRQHRRGGEPFLHATLLRPHGPSAVAAEPANNDTPQITPRLTTTCCQGL